MKEDLGFYGNELNVSLYNVSIYLSSDTSISLVRECKYMKNVLAVITQRSPPRRLPIVSQVCVFPESRTLCTDLTVPLDYRPLASKYDHDSCFAKVVYPVRFSTQRPPRKLSRHL